MSYAIRIRRSLKDCRPKLSLGLDLFEEGYCLDLFGFLIALPFLDRFAYEPHEIMEKWGISYFERSVMLDWGRHCKIIHMPWSYDFISHEVLRDDGTWGKYVSFWEGAESDHRQIERHPYRYVLRSGEVQERVATVYIDRMEWRQKWLKWCPWFARKRQSIDVQFDGEVGERSGSWKGGCLGCGYDMLPGESMLQTLQRMEKERKFN